MGNKERSPREETFPCMATNWPFKTMREEKEGKQKCLYIRTLVFPSLTHIHIRTQSIQLAAATVRDPIPIYSSGEREREKKKRVWAFFSISSTPDFPELPSRPVRASSSFLSPSCSVNYIPTSFSPPPAAAAVSHFRGEKKRKKCETHANDL